MNICSIYIITNSINNKYYIGQTWQKLPRRWKTHRSPSQNGCPKLHNALNKHGRENFRIECIASCNKQEDADYLEDFFIQKYNSIKNGYNIMPGGGGRKTFRHSPETIAKLKIIASNRSDEYKLNMSKIKTGRIVSEETKIKQSIIMTGRKLTEEHKQKIASSLLGKTREKYNITSKKIRIVSNETKRKMSESMKGRIPWNKGIKNA